MKPEFAILRERRIDGFKVVEVDTNRATYQGRAWKSLGDWGKRKFENLLVLDTAKERMKVIYV